MVTVDTHPGTAERIQAGLRRGEESRIFIDQVPENDDEVEVLAGAQLGIDRTARKSKFLWIVNLRVTDKSDPQ